MGTAQVSSASGLDKQSVTTSLQRWCLRNYGTIACVPCLLWRRVRCRILILINGSRGDVQPMISLARRLQQLGHRVCMLTNADLVDFCKSHGTDTRAVFPDAHAVILKLGGMVGEYVQMARLAKKAGDEWMLANPGICSDAYGAIDEFKPDLLIYSFASSGPAIRYELQNGVPAVPVLFHRGSAELFESYLNMIPLRPSFLSTSPVVETKPTLSSSEPNALHQTGPWRIDDEINRTDSASLLTFLAGSPAPVALGWGSMLAKGQSPQDLLVLALRALLASRRRGVIMGGWARLDELGQNFVHNRCLEGLTKDEAEALANYAKTECCFVSSVPHSWLFPQCSCVVHHGGSGTTHATLLAGRPAVVTPIFFDQFHFSQAISHLGAGVGFTDALPSISAEALAAAICDAEGMAPAAQRYARQMRAEIGVGGAAACLQAFLKDEVVTGKWKYEWLQVQQRKAEERKRCKVKAAARTELQKAKEIAADSKKSQIEASPSAKNDFMLAPRLSSHFPAPMAHEFLAAPRLGLPTSFRADKTGWVESTETEAARSLDASSVMNASRPFCATTSQT